MADQLLGNSTAITLPAAVNIASTTAATPIVVTTSAPHGLITGNQVIVVGSDAPLANGNFVVTYIDATSVSLNGSASGAVGGAVGTITNQGFGVTITIPADNDDFDAASVNVAFGALADMTALLVRKMQWEMVIPLGGSIVISGSFQSNNTAFFFGSLSVTAATTFEVGSAPVFEDTITLGSAAETPLFSARRSFSRVLGATWDDGPSGGPPTDTYWINQTGRVWLNVAAAPTAAAQQRGWECNDVLPQGSFITSANVWYQPAPAHGAMPATQPFVQIVQQLVTLPIPGATAPYAETILATAQDAIGVVATYELFHTLLATVPVSGLSRSIQSVSNATPILITTTAAHGETTGNIVTVAGTASTTLANGTWKVTVTGATTYTLDGSQGGVAAGVGGTTEGECTVDLDRYRYFTRFITETGVNAKALTAVYGCDLSFDADGMDEI